MRARYRLAVLLVVAPSFASGATVLCTSVSARAEGGAAASMTIFFEPGSGTEVTNLTPSVDLRQSLGETLTLSAGYEADIVSGATERIVDAPGVDAVSGASFDDLRHSIHGALELRHDVASLSAGYSHGLESDYVSHALALTAGAELFERNTRLELTWARAWDSVCNLLQPRATEAVERQGLDSSDGCFEDGNPRRTESSLALHTFQLSWTQNLSATIAAQVVGTANVSHGFQTNPYRTIWLGRGAAPEHAPEDRARYAIGLRLNWWLRPLRGVVQLSGRFYRDTWDIQSVTAELAYEQHLGALFRVRARGRYYSQSAAAFFSDDYGREPRGEYFVGDRELSDFSSVMLGARVSMSVASDEEGRVLGFLSGLELVGRFDWTTRSYGSFRLSGREPTDTDALVFSVGLDSGW